MALVEQLQTDMQNALRAKQQARLDTLRMALAALKNARIQVGHDLNNDEVLKVLQKEVKQRRDAAAAYRQAQRPDLAEQEEAEIAILDEYLPTMLDADTLRPLIAQIIAETGASSPADISKVMPVAMQQFKGKAEGRTINQLVRELLAQ